MKKIFIVIFAAMFIGVFSLNVNYQIKPVDSVWGLNNAVADESNTFIGSLIVEIIKIGISLGESLANSNDTPPVFHWNSEERECIVEVYRKQNALASVQWVVKSSIVGGVIDGSYVTKKVAGNRMQSIWVEKNGKYFRECEAETACVPNT